MKREARLKPEHAHLYPGIHSGVWEAAGMLADKALACRLLLPSGGFVLNERALHAEHRGRTRRNSCQVRLSPGTLHSRRERGRLVP